MRIAPQYLDAGILLDAHDGSKIVMEFFYNFAMRHLDVAWYLFSDGWCWSNADLQWPSAYPERAQLKLKVIGRARTLKI